MSDQDDSNSKTSRIPDLARSIDDTRHELDRLRRSIIDASDVLDVANQTRNLLERQSSFIEAPAGPVLCPQRDGQSVRHLIRDWARPRVREAEWEPATPRVWDAVALVVILIAAAAIRFWDLGELPEGMLETEAIAGLEARRIVSDGWIGIYSPAADGTPTLFYYLATPLVWLLGSEILPLRIVSALADLAFVAAFYVLLRRNLGFASAMTGTTLVGCSLIHLHFARIGLPVALWPLAVVLALLAFSEAVRRKSPTLWGATGALFAAGLYCYDSHLLLLGFAFVLAVFAIFNWQASLLAMAIGALVLWPSNSAAIAVTVVAVLFALTARARDGQHWLRAVACGAGFAIVAAPMARVMHSNPDLYFRQGRQLSLFRSDAWTEHDSVTDRAQLLFERYVD